MIEDCIEAASKVFGIPAKDIRGPSQSHPRCRARQAAIYMARERGCGVAEIAHALRRAKSQVSKAYNRSVHLQSTNPRYSLMLNEAEKELAR